MSKYDVSDYGIFDSAICVNSSYKEEINTLSNTIDECKSSLNDSVFMGPISDNCQAIFGQISSKVNDIISKNSSVESTLSSVSSNYQSGDSNASREVTNVEGGNASTNLVTSQAASPISTPLANNVSSTGAVSSGNVNTSIYASNPGLGFNITTDNKTYNLSDTDFDILCAVVASESDGTCDDALAVSSAILNRLDDPACLREYGSTPIDQVSAPNQFSVWSSGSYKSHLNGNYSDTVRQSVTDALAGVRNHDYLSFRANFTNYSNNMISSSGNRYK